MKDIHVCLKPRSVGPNARTADYLRWLAHSQQLWRWEVYVADEIKVTPIERGYRGEHSQPPRKKDKVIIGDERLFGVILYINYGEEEAMVRVFENGSYEDRPYDLSVFETNPGGRVPWRILG